MFQLSVQQQPEVGMLGIIRKVTENMTEGSVQHCTKPGCTSTLCSAHSSDPYITRTTVDLQRTERRAMKRVGGMERLLSEKRLKRLKLFHLER